MTNDPFQDDPIMTALCDLPTGEPDHVRKARTRDRCLASLAKRRPAARRGARVFGSLHRRALEPALIVGACLVFLAEVVSRALRHYRF
jgi:hypothetical protein